MDKKNNVATVLALATCWNPDSLNFLDKYTRKPDTYVQKEEDRKKALDEAIKKRVRKAEKRLINKGEV